MKNLKGILSKSLEDGTITVPEWNSGIYIYIIYRIVWETKSHYILYSVDTEEQAKDIVEDFKNDEYFYQKVKVN